MTTKTAPQWVTPNQLAAAAQKSNSTVRRWLTKGLVKTEPVEALSGHPQGKRHRIPIAEASRILTHLDRADRIPCLTNPCKD